MGRKYNVIARNFTDMPWVYDWEGDFFIVFIFKGLYALIKYDIVTMGKRDTDY